ncbi:hypothetical protein HDU67_000322 [Dinochytrium kinnereticum]|nr:hypothetical protein HDU67_000322 [Dinochytrium kinnereticum]
MKSVYLQVKQRVQEVQDKQAAQANKKRLQDPFKIGDPILHTTKDYLPPNIKDRPNRKLGAVYSGPHKILEKIGISYKLDLPEKSTPGKDVCRVFHPEKLRP